MRTQGNKFLKCIGLRQSTKTIGRRIVYTLHIKRNSIECVFFTFCKILSSLMSSMPWGEESPVACNDKDQVA